MPSLTCGFLAWRLLVVVRDWLEGWEQISLNLLGFDYTFDLIELLQLKELLTTLQTVVSNALPLLLALTIAAGILGGLLIALTLVLLGWGYNLLAWLTGGIAVELQELPPTTQQTTPRKLPRR